MFALLETVENGVMISEFWIQELMASQIPKACYHFLYTFKVKKNPKPNTCYMLCHKYFYFN